MRKLILVLMAMTLCLVLAAAEGAGTPGTPFPDFTVTDSGGNTFTLSEALKDHDAVLINFIASWCAPCALEAPFLEDAYAEAGGRAAFIALSCEGKDTPELLETYRRDLGITYPVGRDEDCALFDAIHGFSLPTTVIVDRFGNVVFRHEAGFKSAREVKAVLGTFLGEDYAETAVLDGIPVPDATAAFPVGPERDVWLENEHVRELVFTNDAQPTRLRAYITEDETAHVRVSLPASDSPYDMVLYDWNGACVYELPLLLSADRGAYALDVPLPGLENNARWANVCLLEWGSRDTSGAVDVYLMRGEEAQDELCEYLGREGWTLSETRDADPAGRAAPQAYVLHVVDQYGEPVPGVYVNFCTDMACVPAKADEQGVITFTGAPDRYHLQLLRVPEGCGFDRDFEMYTGTSCGEWQLRIRRD